MLTWSVPMVALFPLGKMGLDLMSANSEAGLITSAERLWNPATQANLIPRHNCRFRHYFYGLSYYAIGVLLIFLSMKDIRTYSLASV